jgi:DNA-binding XRE family transcriptional regulator
MENALALSEIREKRELTQTDIAEVLEMSQAT